MTYDFLEPASGILLGAIVGGLISYLANNRSAKLRMRDELKYETYRQFLESIALLNGSHAETPEKYQGMRLSITSRQKIALIGSPSVVRAASNFAPHVYDWGNISFETLKPLIAAMRQDLNSPVKPDFEAFLDNLLFDLGGHPPPHADNKIIGH